MPSSPPLAFSDLYEQGTALCAEWEELGARQFAALAAGDNLCLSVIHAHQVHLAEQFYHLEQRWQDAIQSLPAPSAFGEDTGIGIRASLRTKRHEFVAAVQGVFAANRRSLKALNVLISLNMACEPLACAHQPQTYNHAGALMSGGQTLTARLDCQG